MLNKQFGGVEGEGKFKRNVHLMIVVVLSTRAFFGGKLIMDSGKSIISNFIHLSPADIQHVKCV